jgi:hypothetical protein
MPWLEESSFYSVWEHRTVRWCIGQCPVRQAGSSKVAALGTSTAVYDYISPDCPMVHRTVRWANGRPGQRSAAQSARDTWPSQRLKGGTGLSGVHRTCPVRQRLSGCQRSAAPFLEGNRAPDCPVHQSTEGKISLPRMLSTAPCCPGAIKGTPRRMEKHTKHSYNISKHQDLDSAHLFHCDSI